MVRGREGMLACRWEVGLGGCVEASVKERVTYLLEALEQLEGKQDQHLLREKLRLLRDDLRQREDQGRVDEWFRLAVDAAETGIWSADLTTGQVTWNSQHARIFGLEHGDFRGD